MSRPRLTLLFLVTMCVAAASQDHKAKVSPQNVIKDWVATVNMNDSEKILAFYDRSEKTEVIVSSGVSYQGYKALQKAYEDAFKEVRHYDSSAKGMRTRLFGDTAIVTFEHLLKIQIAADNSHWQIHVRTTSVLHRYEDKWKIVLEHSSPIRGIDLMTPIENDR